MRERQKRGRPRRSGSGPSRDRNSRQGGRSRRGPERDADPLGNKNDDPFRGRRAVDIDETEFSDQPISEPLLQALARTGYRSLTEFQEEAIPVLLEGNELIAQAAESSGRTTASLVPLLNRLISNDESRILVVVPTRRLGGQVAREARRLLFYLDRKCALIDPGSSIDRQAESFEANPAVVVATPGRFLDHIRRGNVASEYLDALVVLEVDRIVDQNQQDDVEEIIESFDTIDQTVLLSNNVTPRVLRFCRKHASDAKELFPATEQPDPARVSHRYVVVDPRSRIKALVGLIEEEKPESAVVFCRSKESALRIADRIYDMDGGVTDLHAGIPQRRRDQLIERFRKGDFRILVSTEAAFQRLGADNVTCVVNYDLPEHPDDYLFRLNPMAKCEGKVFTLVSGKNEEFLDKIEEITDQRLEEKVIAGLDRGVEERDEEPEPVMRDERTTADDEPSEAPAKPVEDVSSRKDDGKKKSIPNSSLFHGGWNRKSWRWKP